jgi:hypothetical protein
LVHVSSLSFIGTSVILTKSTMHKEGQELLPGRFSPPFLGTYTNGAGSRLT